MPKSAQSGDALAADLQAATERCRELDAELARRDAELRASELRYRTFLDHTTDGLFLHGPDARVVDVNQRACESLGYSRDELIGMSPTSFDASATAADIDRNMERLRGGETLVFDSCHRRKDGSEYPVEVRIRPVWIDQQLHALALACDITERKRTEEKLLASESRYRTFADYVTDALFLQDSSTRVVDVNQRACESLGYSRDEMIGMHPSEFDPDVTPAMVERVISRLDAGETVAFESRHRRKDGTTFPVEVRIRPFWLDDQRHALALACDISERKRAEEALRESQRFIERIASASPHIMYVFDRLRRQIVYCNRPAAADLGYTLEEIAANGGELFFELLHPDELRHRSVLVERWNTARDDEVIETEFRLRDRDDNWHWFLARDTVFTRTPNGQVEQIIGTAQDITGWKQAEEDLAARQAELLHASRLTTVGRMVAALSHEVAQPLSAIGNYAAACDQILRTAARAPVGASVPASPAPASDSVGSPAERSADDLESVNGDVVAGHLETLHEYIQAIAKQNHRCGAILERLRDFSQRTSAKRSSCDVEDLLRDSVALVSNELRRHNVDVRFDLQESLPPVFGDRVQLQQVVVNLLTNARDAVCHQADEHRAITIHAVVEDDSVVFEVADSGTGFADEVAARLFEPFYTTKESGMGIGLSICHSIIKDHHGQIEALSDDKGGATFRVRLPIPRKDDHG